MNPIEEKILNDIKKHGWNVMSVLESEDSPAFAYSIGLYKTFQHPEIIVFGLPLDLMHYIINTIGREVKIGKAYTPEHYYDNLIRDFQCTVELLIPFMCLCGGVYLCIPYLD